MAPTETPTTAWWLQGSFAPVDGDLTAAALAVEGVLQPELTAVFVRNGPNPFGFHGSWIPDLR